MPPLTLASPSVVYTTPEGDAVIGEPGAGTEGIAIVGKAAGDRLGRRNAGFGD